MKIIALEGIDASGKETQVSLLTKALQERGFKAKFESFPRYGKPIGHLIAQWLGERIELTDKAAHMLYEADRQDFIDSLNEDEYDYLILDRFTLSNIAFAVPKLIDPSWITDLQAQLPVPDLTFFVDISPGTSLQRRPFARDKHETDQELLGNARSTYHRSIESLIQQGYQAVIVDGEQTVEEIHREILSHTLSPN